MRNPLLCFLGLVGLITLSISGGRCADTSMGTLRTTPPPKTLGDLIKLSDYGSDDVAYLTLPATAPVGGVVMIHEWWGLNDYIKATADRLAKEGFVVVAVDLYNGQVATDPSRARELMENLNESSALRTVEAATNFLHQSPRFRCDRVGTLGWCMGGGVSLRAALDVKGLAAAVVYYGPTVQDEKRLSHLRVPLLGIYGLQDQTVKPTDVHALDDLLTKLNKPHDFHWFDAVHAFANPSNADYRADYAQEAWGLTVAFLKQHLSEKAPEPSVIDRVFH